jgi:TonB dependent receptor/TonB-dependent Receptor Plug Domain
MWAYFNFCVRSVVIVAGLAGLSSQAFAQEPLPAITVTPPPPAKPRPKQVPAKKAPPPGQATSAVASAALPTGAPTAGSGPTVAPTMASQLTIPGGELIARPVPRPGDILEAAPGLIVTQHSGEGKANQYFLRGYNLDHGTDMAIYVDDMPINMRTHAHGQGYSDLNWLMPETVNAVDVRKGPYFADEGDFSSAGNLHIVLVDATNASIAQVTVGSFGYERLFAMSSTKASEGNLLVATEVATYNGPWVNPDDMRKLNGLLRYSQGNALDGFSITGMAYSNRWNSTDQVPERAIASGQISRFGEEDPTDGGSTSRFSLSGRMAKSDDAGAWKANAYIIESKLDLFNDFTYFLANPTLGDQFHQRDERFVSGANVARTFKGSIGDLPAETAFGIQTRYDAIDLGLTDTYHHAFLANIRSDKVEEGSIGVYAETTVHWSTWLKTTVGWRGDYFDATVDSIYDANNSGHVQAGLGSPKFTLVLGPFDKTEFFFGAGEGMHSNDARGATTTESPTDPATKLTPSPLLVRTEGVEVGVRSKALAGFDTSLSLFLLDQASEIVFNGDAGDTSPSRPSQRYGIEWTNKYHPYSWLTIDGDLAWSHARFLGYDTAQAALYASLAGYPQAQIGNAPGNFIPNAPAIVASAGVTLGEKNGWFGTLRWRYLGPTSLTEDGAFQSPAISIINGRVGYRFDDGWTVHFDALNILNAKTNQITYAYGSLIKSDNLFSLCFPVQIAPAAVCQNGVMDQILHPIEPLAFRLTVSKAF